MISRQFFLAAVIFLIGKPELGNSYRILGICAVPTTSHQVVFRGVTLALNKRGHELVVVTANPVNDRSLKNYTEIDISFGYDMIKGLNFINNQERLDWYTETKIISNFSSELSDRILDYPEVRRLYAPDSDEKFDLVLIEMIYWPALFPLGKRFDVPVIGVSSLSTTTNIQYVLGDPILPSHEGNWEIGARVSRPRSFWQRLENFVIVWEWIYWYRTSYMSVQNAIARKHFGDDTPDLEEFEKNVSLIFVNQQPLITPARPSVPKVIQIGGAHVTKEPPALPKDLQKMFDEATQGFVYMSLGGTGKSSMLPQKTIDRFIAAFSRLPYKVLWKFEADDLPGKPENVHIMKWVPQLAVLAHPNLKVFVYQGGLQSTEEAIAQAVPLVGFPSFADQEMQVSRMTSLGVAIKLDINAVDDNALFEAVTTVANDHGYKQRMLSLRSLLEDKPHDPLDNAVWWTEYVIRNKGAPHLHSSTADLPWYSRHDMDVVAFISVATATVLSSTIVAVVVLFRAIRTWVTKSFCKKVKIN